MVRIMHMCLVSRFGACGEIAAVMAVNASGPTSGSDSKPPLWMAEE